MHSTRIPSLITSKLDASELVQTLNTDPAMFLCHMAIHARTLPESLQAHPTNMGLASRTLHVVASATFLQMNTAFRTRLYPHSGRPVLEGFVLVRSAVAVVRTMHPVMILNMACWTYLDKASRAAQSLAFRGGTVHHFTVRCRAVMKLIGSTMHEGQEGRSEQLDFFCGSEQVADECKGDIFSAHCTSGTVGVLNATQGKLFGVCCRPKIVLHARFAVDVLTRKSHEVLSIARRKTDRAGARGVNQSASTSTTTGLHSIRFERSEEIGDASDTLCFDTVELERAREYVDRDIV